MNAVEWGTAHSRFRAGVHLLVFLVCLWAASRVRIDNSPRVFFSRDAGALDRLAQAERDFDAGISLQILLEGRGLWNREGLAWLADLEDAAANLPGVVDCWSPLTLFRRVRPWWPPDDPRELRRCVLDSPGLAALGGIGADAESIILSLTLSPRRAPGVLRTLNTLLQSPPPGIRARPAGLPAMQQAMDQALTGDTLPFILLLAFLAGTGCLLVLGGLRPAAGPLGCVVFTLVLTLGIMGMTGTTLNLVTIVAVPLLLVITLATAVHVQVHAIHLRRKGSTGGTLVHATYATKARTVLWAGLTTMVAFGSMGFSASRPVYELGVWTALGMGAGTLGMFTLMPLFLQWWAKQDIKKNETRILRAFSRLGRGCARCATRHPLGVLLAAAGVTALILPGISRVTAGDRLDRYFRPGHPLRDVMDSMDSRGMGVFPAYLVLRLPLQAEAPGFCDPALERRLGRLTARLRSQPGIVAAFGVADAVDAAVDSLLVDGDASGHFRGLARALLSSLPPGRRLLHGLVTPGGRNARLHLSLAGADSRRVLYRLNEAARMARLFFPGVRVDVTGEYPLLALAQTRLTAGLVASFGLTLACILLVLLVVSTRTATAARMVVPNLWPILILAGGMGWLGMPLDSVVVMTFCVVLGLAVDDTLHTLGYLGRSSIAPRRRLIVAVLSRTAPAQVLTSLILAAGFAACAVSPLQPVARMGLTAAVGILLALAGDLLLVPALLILRRSRWPGPRGGEPPDSLSPGAAPIRDSGSCH